ncbi:MAG: leucyl/phenylalanyl-tRNA--protein transferase [Nitrospirota bacterium]|nr:leucyl/phenylalanyl-tRNA--protein transferase [Nitrospirota bacterium]
MTVFRLADDMVFPPSEMAEDNGLLAVGGDLSERRLLLAYSLGIFPWYSDGSPILWWSPDPRLVLIPEELRVSRSLRQVIKKGIYSVTMDVAFDVVIRNCAAGRGRKEEGTWITDEMINAYNRLHELGFAHSVEVWRDGSMVGGLYGVAMGAVYFGESMFSEMKDASKVALVKLVGYLIEKGYKLIDCQVPTEHLISMGAKEVSREEFQVMFEKALKVSMDPGKWSLT